MAEKRKKRGAHLLTKGKVVPLYADAMDVIDFLNACNAELSAELAACPDHEYPGHAWPEQLLRKWRAQIDDLLPAKADGAPRKVDRAHLKALDAWKAKNPERPESDYYRKYMGAKTDKEVRACRSALSRARNSK